jgi:adenylate cyclase
MGMGYSTLIGFADRGTPAMGGLIGAVHGLAIAALIGLLEIFAGRTPVGRKVEQAPLAVIILVKGLLYGAVITAVELGDLGVRMLRGLPSEPAVQSSFLPLSVVFSFVVTFAFIFVLQMGRLVGGRTLRNIVLGRYHRARSEERFFLFVDVVGSTGIAERLGPLSMHRFLNRVFSLAADPVADQHGEIYQYVGDEMVVTWTVAAGRIRARPVACFFAIEDALSVAAQGFERDFGVTPGLRGALHAGSVVTGEVGESKREIVFHGDVMNAAARLEQAARELGHKLLASEEARRLLLNVDRFGFGDLGPLALRGRAAPVQVFVVTRKP